VAKLVFKLTRGDLDMDDNVIFCRMMMFSMAREELKPLGLGVFKDSQVWARPKDRRGKQWCEFWGPEIDGYDGNPGATFYHSGCYSNAYEARSEGWTAYLKEIGAEGYQTD